MTTVFTGGSRAISRLNPLIRQRLDRIIAKGLPVIIGDANGADKTIQQYFQSKAYQDVEVFCSGSNPRNNLGGWKLRRVRANAPSGTVAYYTAKDQAMTDEATVGFMLWDGKSAGTLANVYRLISQHKKVVLYLGPTREFRELKTKADWDQFFSGCNRELRNKVGEREESATPSMFDQIGGADRHGVDAVVHPELRVHRRQRSASRRAAKVLPG